MLFSGTSSAIISVLAALISSVIIIALRQLTGTGAVVSAALTATMVFAVSLIIYFRAELVAMLTRNKSWRLPPRVVSKWSYEDSERGLVEIEDLLELKQTNSFISGAVVTTLSRSEAAPFLTYRYALKAAINQEGVISGQWKSREKGRNYYGLFVLSMSRGDQMASGGWLGIGSRQVRNGQWVWSRSDR